MGPPIHLLLIAFPCPPVPSSPTPLSLSLSLSLSPPPPPPSHPTHPLTHRPRHSQERTPDFSDLRNKIAEVEGEKKKLRERKNRFANKYFET